MRNETKYCINSCLYGLRCIITSNISFSWIRVPTLNASAVLIGGFILGWKYGLIIGVVTPLYLQHLPVCQLSFQWES